MDENIDSSLRELVDKWMRWDKNPDTLTEVTNLVNSNQWDRLGKMMNKRLEFGTAGIRGRMGAGFGQMNDLVIIQVTQGLLEHLTADCPDVR